MESSQTIEADAARYRWLKNVRGLNLQSCTATWTVANGTKYTSSHILAANGTQFPSLETLDETIDSAILASASSFL